jgi:hypothetical protein
MVSMYGNQVFLSSQKSFYIQYGKQNVPSDLGCFDIFSTGGGGCRKVHPMMALVILPHADTTSWLGKQVGE